MKVIKMIGGLYYAILQEENVTIEDMQPITLLNKTNSFQEDIEEILEYVVEDLNVAQKGIKVLKIQIKKLDFEESFQLKIVLGDLQGLPEIFLNRSPIANDVPFSNKIL